MKKYEFWVFSSKKNYEKGLAYHSYFTWARLDESDLQIFLYGLVVGLKHQYKHPYVVVIDDENDQIVTSTQ